MTGQLLLRAGSALNYETNPLLEVTLVVDDPSLGTTWDHSVTFVLAITDANDSPSIASQAGLTTYVEGGPPVPLAPDAAVADEDGTILSGAVLRAVIVANATTSDRLLLSSSSVSVAANGNVLHNGQAIGSVTSSGLGGAPLEVMFNGAATLWSIRNVLQSVRFETLGDNPSETTRQVYLAGFLPAVFARMREVLPSLGSISHSIRKSRILLALSTGGSENGTRLSWGEQ